MLEIVFKKMYQEKIKLFLNIFSMTWGAFSISFLLAIGEGVRSNFIDLSKGMSSSFIVTPGKTSKVYKGRYYNINIYFKKKDLQAIKELPNILKVSLTYQASNQLEYKGQLSRTKVMAIDSNYFEINNIKVKKGGRFISPIDIKNSSSVIVLGSKAAGQFFQKRENPIGKKISINNVFFLVIGVIDEMSDIFTSTASNSCFSWIPYTIYELISSPKEITSFSVQYKNPDLLEATKKQIQRIIALHYDCDPSDNNFITFLDVEEQQQAIRAFFIGIKFFLLLIGVLNLLLASGGFVSMMCATLSRTIREIGIQVALGAQSYHIIFQYAFETFFVTVIGGIIGILMAEVLVSIIRSFHFRFDFIENIGKFKPILSFKVILIVVIILGVTACLISLFPAIKAVKTNPMEALRYE